MAVMVYGATLPDSHATAIYRCPGCLTTMRGPELEEQRSERPGRRSLRRRTRCCGLAAVLETGTDPTWWQAGR